MPRTKKFGHQKRRLIGKKTSVCVVSEKCDVSSSKKKIEKSKGYFDYEDNFSAEAQSRFVIIDLNMLNDIFNNIAKCIYCDRSFCFDVAENKSSRRGLASSISATCKYCGSSHGSMTSNSVPAGYEVNLSYWDILLLPPILLLVNEFNKNIQNHELSSGDSEPEAIGRHTQEESKFKEQKKRLTSLDFLIQIMIQEDLQRIGKKLTASSK
ncbi:hypothetical protein TNCT_16711 [Trichonephila clavata]|uniref:Uncharacterized protein n=1 Tax=Trichonephila clavata TaxID=2740835 RepID=A0A8X6JF23_TRICU|nr:hypothetical protein TNCT_16711 [Trichonephila clavata]